MVGGGEGEGGGQCPAAQRSPYRHSVVRAYLPLTISHTVSTTFSQLRDPPSHLAQGVILIVYTLYKVYIVYSLYWMCTVCSGLDGVSAYLNVR
jgi:hypothetical protein